LLRYLERFQLGCPAGSLESIKIKLIISEALGCPAGSLELNDKRAQLGLPLGCPAGSLELFKLKRIAPTKLAAPRAA